MAFRVDAECAAYGRMRDAWEIVDALLGGTKAMRQEREKYLPKETDEESPQYEIRLKRAYLFPGLRDALRRVVGMPFVKPVTLQGESTELTKELLRDVDRRGTALHAFLRRLFSSGARYGAVHCLVDAPRFEGQPTLEEERVLRLRPYFVYISARNLFYWRFEDASDGSRQLVEIRYRYRTVEAGPDGSDVEVERIRRITRDEVEVWKTVEGGSWVLESTARNADGKIRLRSAALCPIDDDDHLCASPPFEDLAWVNLEHWQSSADQSVLMRTARFPLLFFRDPHHGDGDGKPEKSKETRVVIGPNRLTRSRQENADLKFVEHTGASVDAGVKELERLEERMVMLGLRPLVERTGGQTATGRVIDEARDTNDVRAWIGALATMATQCFADAAELSGKPLPADFKVSIHTDFAAGFANSEELRLLLDARRQREITRVTFLQELRRRGLISDAINVEDEAAKVAHEEPQLPNPIPFPGGAAAAG
jgi:hypothetical protein